MSLLEHPKLLCLPAIAVDQFDDCDRDGYHNCKDSGSGSNQNAQPFYFSWTTFLTYSGPGCLIAIAYLDPGNLEADLQAGSYTKYELIWALLYSLAAGLILQAMSLRIGVFTGKHLAQLCREEYNPLTAKLLWICAEISIITCDMQAIITSAIAFHILFGFPLWIGCLLTCLDVVTFVVLELKEYHSVEYLFVFLVSVMAVCFFWNFGINPPNAYEIVYGTFVPQLTYHSFAPAVGIVGSIILPQNFFIHSGLVLKRHIDRGSNAKVHEANKYMLIDTTLALLVAFLINLAVISCFAEIFYSQDCASMGSLAACLEADNDSHEDVIEESAAFTQCGTASGAFGVCQKIGLSDAGSALAGTLGPTASIVWAMGLLASGQSSTMTITYAGQFVLDGFFEIKLPLYWRVLFCRLAALIPALVAALASTSNPNQLDNITQWGNIVASICVPFSIVPMLKFTASRALMGENVFSIFTRLFIWLLTIFLVFTNIYLIWEYMLLSQASIPPEVFIPVLCFFTILYLFFIYHVGKDDVDACALSVAIKIGYVDKAKKGNCKEKGGLLVFKPAQLPCEDPDDVQCVTANCYSTMTSTGTTSPNVTEVLLTVTAARSETTN